MLTPLPIHPMLATIQYALVEHNNVVLQAEPGAGKSTAVPLHLLATREDNNTIVMLEPRRVAAKAIAHYLARQLGEKVGERVGYHVKNERVVSHQTQLEIVTEGILTRRLQADPELEGVGLIIFDEFHERSLPADMGLMLASEVQQTLRSDLKLLVMSATIDTQLIANYLSHDVPAKVIHCPGRAFPVTVEYVENRHQPLSEQVVRALQTALKSNDDNGDILVFLSGQADIQQCIKRAQQIWGNNEHIVLLPLFGGLSITEQERAIRMDEHGRRRVIFTTNVAETSLTIDGISWVIDSGLEKQLHYDPASGMTRLTSAFIAKASAEQRKGRAGRVRAGHCIRLWSQAKQGTLRDFQPEDIVHTELTSTVLDLYAWGHTHYDSTPWLTPPPRVHYDTAVALLRSLGLINDTVTTATRKGSHTPQLTTLGQQATQLAIHPRLAAMLLRCTHRTEQHIACDIAALLTEQDIFRRDGASYPSVDIAERFLALQEVALARKKNQKCPSRSHHHPVHTHRVNHVLALSNRLRKRVDALLTLPATHSHSPLKTIALSDYSNDLPRLLFRAYPDRLARQRKGKETTRYLMANGKGVVLDERDALFGNEWIIVHDANVMQREGKIYSACAIAHHEVLSLIEKDCEEKTTYTLDAKKQKIIGRQYRRYRAITVSEHVVQNMDKQRFHDSLADLLRLEGTHLLQWTDRCEQWLARVQWLAKYPAVHASMDLSLPELSTQQLMASVEEWLLPYIGHITQLAALKHYDIYALLTATLTWDQQHILDAEAPVNYTSPSGKTVPIIYDKHQGPIVSIVLQEMFGELGSPRLAYGQVPLRFELLSPARRPIQTTSDLANFWVSSYIDVAKDMRAQYPKHRWPEKPLLAEAGQSRKRYTSSPSR